MSLISEIWIHHYVLLTGFLSSCLLEYSKADYRFQGEHTRWEMGPAITSTRISHWVCGKCSLLRYQVDHCIIAQTWLSWPVSIVVLASCHLMSQSPLQRTPLSVCQQKIVWDAFTKILFVLALLPFPHVCRWSVRCWVWQQSACILPDTQPGGGCQRCLFKLATCRAAALWFC